MKNLFRRKYLFRSNDSKFELNTSLKIVSVPIIALVFFAVQFWVFLRSIYSFFAANNTEVFNMSLSAFYDAAFSDMTDQLPYLGLYLILIFFAGSHISVILLRQFKKIEEFCEDPPANGEFKLSGLERSELLAKISFDFFKFINVCKQTQKFEGKELGQEYSKHDKPPVDWVFYLQYFIILGITTTFAGALLHVFMVDTYDAIANLGKTFSSSTDQTLNTFIASQLEILDMIFWSTISLVILLYVILSHNIIVKITGVSYAIFKVMHEIMEGNFSLRIRIRYREPGHAAAYKFNRYLDSIIPPGQSFDHRRKKEK